MSRFVFVIAREEADLFRYVAREFAGEPTIEVILDRRSGSDRRHGDADGTSIGAIDRRRGDRRGQTDVADQLRTLGYAIIRPPVESGLTPAA